jgi:hypothetical protein
MMANRIGMSEETMRHHVDQHLKGCADDATAILCARCNEPMFVAAQPGTWCVHARQLADAFGE